MRVADYLTHIHKPLSDAVRRSMSNSHLTRMGTPLGSRRVYGSILPERVAMTIYSMIAEICRTEGRAKAELEAARFQGASEATAIEAVSLFRMMHAESRKALRKKVVPYADQRRPVRQATKPCPKPSKDSKLAAIEVALEDAMLLYDEGLSVEQISKATLLKRTKILEQIRATKRAS